MPEETTQTEASPKEAAPSPELTALQQQINDLKEQVAESNRTAQFWAEKARQPAPAAPAAAAEPEEDDTDVLEAITTGGVKGFDTLAAKRGYVKRDEVENLINQRATVLTREQQLIEEYPDLKKKDSEFFRATAVNYGSLVRSGTPAPIAMELAAKQTELEFLRSGKMKIPAEAEKERKEADRLARVAAQSGENGRGRPAPGSDDDGELTPQQKHIADAMGITHEAYAKRAKAGVAIRGNR
jgi:hypothetical protein